MQQVALVLFGGVCSGKTTFSEMMETEHGFLVLSKDRNIYDSDMLKRQGKLRTWEELRQEGREHLLPKNIILDETIRVGDLAQIKDLGYKLIGIRLNSEISIRQNRLDERILRQKAILSELSDIVKINLHEMDQDKRRDLWTDMEFYNSIEDKKKDRFDLLLRKIYLLGALTLKNEDPNPICFSELDLVADLKNIDVSSGLSISTIIEKSVPFEIYKRDALKKIKYCVWDIGGVVYDFTLDHLHNWMGQNTTDINLYQERRGKFSYNPYMQGHISYEELCRQLCEFYAVPFSYNVVAEIAHMMWKGVGEDFPESRKMMSILQENGIENCILSNALSVLLDSGNYQTFVKPVNRFYSFNINALKPHNDAYQRVKESLKVEYDEMIFIDDKKKNVSAAMNLGIYSIVYNKSTIEKQLLELI